MSRSRSKSNAEKPKSKPKSTGTPPVLRGRWRQLAFAGLLTTCIILAVCIVIAAGPKLLPQASAQQNPAAPATSPATKPSKDAIHAAAKRARAILAAATRRASTQPAPSKTAQIQTQAKLRTYYQLQGQVSFMQDHLARMQSRGSSSSDTQSIQAVISDLQKQVQTAAASTQASQ